MRCILLPPGHGKTTFHQIRPNIFDGGQLVDDKVRLRELRRMAVVGDITWDEFDTHWANEIKDKELKDDDIILLPSESIASMLSATILATLILPVTYLRPILESRPKSGVDYALSGRDYLIREDKNCVFVINHEEIKKELLRLAENKTHV